MSMYGSVTDAQVFSRELSDQEMVDMTSCKYEQSIDNINKLLHYVSSAMHYFFYISQFRRFLQGDIINWEREIWDLRSPWNRSVSEILDLEKDVCNKRERGLFMVPQKLNFQESLHVCKKLAGKVITYTDRDEFDDIVYFLSLTPNMRSSACIDIKESSSLLQVWAGGSDEQVEGVWTTYDNNTSIEVNVIDQHQKCAKHFIASPMGREQTLQ